MGIMIWIFFGGFLISQRNLDTWTAPLHYSSFIKYGYEALMLNEFDGVSLEPLACQFPEQLLSATATINARRDGAVCRAARRRALLQRPVRQRRHADRLPRCRRAVAVGQHRHPRRAVRHAEVHRLHCAEILPYWRVVNLE